MKRPLSDQLEPSEKYHAIQIPEVDVQKLMQRHPPTQVEGDGNCFWYAIAAGLQDSWEECKRRTLDAAERSPFVHECYTPEVRAQQIMTCSQDNEWANELMVVAASHAFNRYVVVADRQGLLYAVGNSENPVLAVYFDMNHYQAIVSEEALAALSNLVESGKKVPMFNGQPGVRLRGGGRVQDPSMCVLEGEAENHWLAGESASEMTKHVPNLMAANLTSLRTNLDAALTYNPTVLVVAETKMGPTSIQGMKHMLAAKGFALQAQCAPCAGDSHAQKSGVAVIVRAPYSVRVLEDCELPSDATEWKREGRLLHTFLLSPDGKELAVVVAVYSDVRVKESGAVTDSVSRLCDHLEELTVMYGKVPLIVAGDFNLGPHELPAFDRLREGGALRDVHQALEAHPRIPTMVKGKKVNDYVLANPAACEMITRAHTITTARIPVHRPLLCDLCLESPLPRPRLVLPHELVLPVKPDPVAGNLWFVGKMDVEEALRARNPEQLLLAWSMRWEAYLRHHALAQDQKANASYMGRGAAKAWGPCVALPVVNVGGAVFDSVAVRKISNLMASIAQTIDAGLHSPSLESALRKIRDKVTALGWSGWERVDFHELQELYGDADGRLLHQRARDKKQRVDQWRHNMSAEGDPTCRKTCQYVRSTSIQPLSAVVIDDQPVTDVEAIDDHLIDYWSHIGGDVVDDMESAEEYIDHWCPQAPA